MTDPTPGTDRAGRRSKRFLTPLRKYEIFVRLVRQEVTMMEAAEAWEVDRSTITRIRTVANGGALEAVPTPGRQAQLQSGQWTTAKAVVVAAAEVRTAHCQRCAPAPVFCSRCSRLAPKGAEV